MDKISTVKKKILEFIENQGIKKEDFFSKTGISSSNFKGINLKSHLSSDKIANILTAYPNLSVEWLFSNDEDGLNFNQKEESEKYTEIEQKKEPPFEELPVDKKLNNIYYLLTQLLRAEILDEKFDVKEKKVLQDLISQSSIEVDLEH